MRNYYLRLALGQKPNDKKFWQYPEFWDRRNLPVPTFELRFCPDRLWRFDCAWEPQKVALEVDGGVFVQGGHTRGFHFMSDAYKRGVAQKLGWKVFNFTPEQVEGKRQLNVQSRQSKKRWEPLMFEQFMREVLI